MKNASNFLIKFQIVRTQLLPGLMKTLASNRSLKLPVKLFEVQEIVQKNEDVNGTGAKNQRNICAVYTGTGDTFEVSYAKIKYWCYVFTFLKVV